MEIMTRTMGLVERAEPGDKPAGMDEENRIIPFIASTETSVDSHRSIILQDGLDWETRYRDNPLFAWSHPLHRGECEPPPDHQRALGKGIKVEQLEGKTRVWVQFANHQAAREIFEMYRDGFLNACSIGLGAPYAEVRLDSPQREIMQLPEFARTALENGLCDFVVTRGVVLELSACLAGSNREALAERDAASLDRRMEARERAFCTRAQRKMDELNAMLARIDASTVRLERASMTPEERELADLATMIEADPALRALLAPAAAE